MIVHPELQALRGDDSPQRQAQARLQDAMLAWRASPEAASVIADLEQFSQGGDLGEFPALSDLFAGQSDLAIRLVNGFTGLHMPALAQAPLGQPCLKHFTDGGNSTLLLARSGGTTLALVAIDGEVLRELKPRTSASFAPVESWERVMAGTAIADLARRPPAPGPIALERLSLEPGTIVQRNGQYQSLVLRQIDGVLVSLRLQRRHAEASVTREHDFATGALLRQASGNPRDSRLELMLALLGRMKRSDAAPAMAQLATGHGSDALRWQALRECLALDTAQGFAALTTLARCATDPLAAPAGALRAQLIEAYPQLERLVPCPA